MRNWKKNLKETEKNPNLKIKSTKKNEKLEQKITWKKSRNCFLASNNSRTSERGDTEKEMMKSTLFVKSQEELNYSS